MKCFLAGCHSIVHFSEEGKEENVVAMVGDPLDIASLRYSGWLYDDLTKSYVEPTDSNTTNRKRVYIIRDFPFDPNRRMSSSIVLLQLREGNFQLWQYVKGSPETLKNLCINNTVIDQQAKELETQGYRTIALCAKDISSSDMSRNLFPDGLSSDPTKISKARLKGAQIHRTNFEQTDVLSHSDTKLDFIGFACFDASVRPSSERVVRELSHGGIDCKMLTGDSLNAALSVARKVHMINGNKIAVLDVDTDTVCDENDPVFVFHLVKSHMEKDGSFLTITDQIQTVRVTKKTMKKVLRLQAEGRCTLVSNGNALQCFLDRIEDFKPFSAKYLSSLAVVARATPDLKRAFVECLQTVSKRTVMMCGTLILDIVNACFKLHPLLIAHTHIHYCRRRRE
jgi:magnesium-transporting ATPase (P-type)